MEFKELRQASGMNQTQFAKYFNIPFRTVQKWGLGERECKPYIIDLMKYKLEQEGICKYDRTKTN